MDQPPSADSGAYCRPRRLPFLRYTLFKALGRAGVKVEGDESMASLAAKFAQYGFVNTRYPYVFALRDNEGGFLFASEDRRAYWVSPREGACYRVKGYFAYADELTAEEWAVLRMRFRGYPEFHLSDYHIQYGTCRELLVQTIIGGGRG